MKYFSRFLAAGACLALTYPVQAQQPRAGTATADTTTANSSAVATVAPVSNGPAQDSLAAFLSSGERPLRLRFADLTPRYQRTSITPTGDSFQQYIQQMSERLGVATSVYYTTGETVTLEGESYLVAYRPQTEINLSGLMPDRDQHIVPKAAPGDELALSLLSVRTIGGVVDVRPFDKARDVMTAEEGNAASLQALRTLGQRLGTAMRASGMAPAFGPALTAQTRANLAAYVGSNRAWRDPRNGLFYTPNPRISGLVVSAVKNAEFLPMLFEDGFAANGTRGVLFLDGHAERVTRDRWQRLEKIKPRLAVPVIVVGR